MTTKINLDRKFSLFDELWRPKVIAAVNGHEVKLVKVKGEFPWHQHEWEDEFFLVWRGRFRVEFRDWVVERWAPENALSSHAALSTGPAPTPRRKSCSSNRRAP
jgi:hypothetical protein